VSTPNQITKHQSFQNREEQERKTYNITAVVRN